MPTALRHAEAAVARAEAAGTPCVLAGAQQPRVLPPQRRRGRPARAARARRRARARGAEAASATTRPRRCSGIQLYDQRRARRGARAAARRARARAAARLPRPRGIRALLLAELEVRAGRWQLADTYAGQRSSSRRHRALELRGRGPLDTGAGRRAPRPGRVRARARGDRAPAGGGARRPRVRDPLLARLGFLALSLGDAEAAVGHLAPLRGRGARGWASASPPTSASRPDLAEALVLAGDLDAAREVQASSRSRGRELGRRGRSRRGCAAAG